MLIDIEAVRIGLQAIWANKLRSSLTIIGVFFGVLSVITIITLMQAMMDGIEEQLSALGPSTFMVNKFGIITSREDYMDALKRKDLTVEDMGAVEEGCLDCEYVAARCYRFGSVKRKSEKLRNVPILGSTANFIDVIDFQVEHGRFFTEMEYQHKRQVAFVGPTIVEELFPGVIDPLGKTIKISGKKYKITGIAKKRGSMMGNNQDNFLVIPLTTQIKYFGKPRHNLALAIKAKNVETVTNTQDQVRSILRARRGVDYYDDDDFSILTAESIMAFVESITLMTRVVIGGIASISMVVGGIVIMNIMMVSVSERTREIGIRKSIGAMRKNIITQFLYEALILTLLGGLLGTSAGIGLAAILGEMMSIDVSVTFLSVAIGMSISLLVGLFFGIYPAVKAAQLDPIEALRYE
ncbi:MAG: ABC transporter permease [candidate division Zixibacteria bacterium]|nr:ABC transporter permease [candidate division Zixibacteria bacterium]